MKSLCFGHVRATRLPPGASSLIMPTCFFVPHKIAHNVRQNVHKVVSRHTPSVTSSVEPWDTNRHRIRQELKRVLRRWQSKTVSGGGLSADAGRDCTISTPTMNDTRIKWNTITLKKKVMVTQFPSETERHCKAKHKKEAICTSHSIVCGFHRERAWTQCSNMRTW